MLKTTRQNVTVRNADRERNVRGSQGSDLVTGRLDLRGVLHHWMAALTRGFHDPRGGIGMKRLAYCPVASPSVAPRPWQGQTTTARSRRSAG